MKNFILGCLFILLTAAGTASIMTVKPATPKTFCTKYFSSEIDAKYVEKYIHAKMKQGWILKAVEGANYGETRSTWIVVMEKY